MGGDNVAVTRKAFEIDDNVSISVPTEICMTVDADGNLRGPSSEVMEIRNMSDTEVRLASLEGFAGDGWNVVSDSVATDDENAVRLAFSVGEETFEVADTVDSEVQFEDSDAWTLQGARSDHAALPLQIEGEIANVAVDSKSKQNLARMRLVLKPSTFLADAHARLDEVQRKLDGLCGSGNACHVFKTNEPTVFSFPADESNGLVYASRDNSLWWGCRTSI